MMIGIFVVANGSKVPASLFSSARRILMVVNSVAHSTLFDLDHWGW